MSNNQKIVENLKRTIAGKKTMLDSLKNGRSGKVGADMAVEYTRQFLQINVDELERILLDLESPSETTCPLTWRDVLCVHRKGFGMIYDVPEHAKNLGYDHFMWNDRIYKVSGKDILETAWTIKDIR